MATYKKRRSYYEIEGNAVRKPEIYVPHEEQAERVRAAAERLLGRV